MKVQPANPAQLLHGKMSKNDPGYFFVTPKGKQKYRTREETYQQNQSPRQKWNSRAFSEAHKQLNALWKIPAQIAQITQDWKDSMRFGPNNRVYDDAKAWKFAMLQQQWKLDNPFESWSAGTPNA